MKSVGSRIRVLVVDDSSFVRKALVRMFEESPEIEVAGVAPDGASALELIEELVPDVITLDVMMPGMDGISTLCQIMERRPTPVIMLSSCTGRGAEKTIRALELGAVDFIDKCSVGGAMDISGLERELTQKIRVAAGIRVALPLPPEQAAPLPIPDSEPPRIHPKLVVVGTSTGGPAALTVVLAKLPAELPCPVLVVQHMPPGFTGPLAERLNRSCAVTVKEAQDGEELRAGWVYIAPGGKHLKLTRRGERLVTRLDLEPEGTLHRPSVDVLFDSAATHLGSGCLAFVLTGMGSDGVRGAMEIKRRGGKVFVEAAETTVVNGMPRAVAAALEVDGTLPLPEVGERISAEVGRQGL
ncbi:chemotaxis response regulator protein-glutamate methylesterase [Geomonas sp. Red32]|uniref:protein-glutamate methylesterase/protein-glutamine glutaminase n=1 Tax=Geomonas sp. Red32 TaxID=2912856 RepID=UPI00202D013B|nr:chemotaxis response regulator protein-glutamate methylesterase [Geomonas sp. Red32]MCM0081101.1 chemotaxis response regulator protein-glutamate methylesterase [Geomonas sp. Red32]